MFHKSYVGILYSEIRILFISRPSIGDAIMKRAAASRAEMRTMLSKMNEKQIECLGKQMFELITDAVENADKSEKVRAFFRREDEYYK